jgi:hypothetical protein
MKKGNPEKRYIVIIEQDPSAADGYDFFSPDDGVNPVGQNKCVVTYYFKQVKHNFLIIIDKIAGSEFEGRKRIIAHFERHHALRYSVQVDGLYKNI